MRIIGFEKEDWQFYYPGGGSCDKMSRDEFSTFRWPRRDGKNYRVGELLQAVIKPRSPKRKPMGIVVVAGREELSPHWAGDNCITDAMARQDGFYYATELVCYLRKERQSPRPDKVYRYKLLWIYRLPKFHEEYLSFVKHGEIVITRRTVFEDGQPDVVARISLAEVQP